MLRLAGGPAPRRGKGRGSRCVERPAELRGEGEELAEIDACIDNVPRTYSLDEMDEVKRELDQVGVVVFQDAIQGPLARPLAGSDGCMPVPRRHEMRTYAPGRRTKSFAPGLEERILPLQLGKVRIRAVRELPSSGQGV